MILVTGANGRLGRLIVQHLIAHSPNRDARELAVSVREPAQVADLQARGVSIRGGDCERPETLPAAFAGVRKLVLLSSDAAPQQCLAGHRHAIAAAQAAGVEHIVYISFLDVAADSPARAAALHRATEALLTASGVPATFMRNTLYADDLPALIAAAGPDGELALPAGTGQMSFVSRNELARAIAIATLAPRLDRQIYELTGQQRCDFATLSAKIARVSGRPLRYADLAMGDEYPAAWQADAGLFAAIAAGHLERLTHDFAALVGHPPKSLDCMIHEYFSPRPLS